MPEVTVSAKGQIVIPRAVRKRLGLEEGTKVTLEITRNGVILRRAKAGRTEWDRWKGRFQGRGLLKALRAEHAREISRDRRRGS